MITSNHNAKGILTDATIPVPLLLRTEAIRKVVSDYRTLKGRVLMPLYRLTVARYGAGLEGDN